MVARLLALFISSQSFYVMAAPPEASIDLATTAGSLVLVVAFILLLAWLVKRMRVPVFGHQKGLMVVRHLSVGTKERIVIIQAGEEQFLVGITANSINLISKLDKPIEVDAPTVTPFSAQLSQLLGKNEKR